MNEFSPFFYEALEKNTFKPTERCIGPWNPKHQHGGPPIALLGEQFFRYKTNIDSFITRFTVELLGPVLLDKMTVRVSMLRWGKRIELLEGVVYQGDRVAMRGVCWRFRRGDTEKSILSTSIGSVDLPERDTVVNFPSRDRVPYIDSMQWRFVSGSFDDPGPSVVWSRPRFPLIEGEVTSPFARLLLMLDSANGVSSVLNFNENIFVPVDMTVALLREPEGEWLGMSAETAIGPLGAGLTTTEMFDGSGSFGRSTHTLFVEQRGE
jgi:hypothetical protein